MGIIINFCQYRKFDDLGWDKVKVPQTFLHFMETLVLKRASYSHSPARKGQDWRTVIGTQQHNLRNGFYNYLGARAKNQHEWYVIRYNDKLDFYRSHFVSS